MKINAPFLLIILLSNTSCTKNWNDVYQAPSGYEKHKIIQQLAQQGDARGQYILSQHYLRGEHVEQDSLLAEQWLQASADNGYAESQYTLALRYNTVNKQYPLNYDQSVKWLKRAAEQGHVNAQYELGEHYRHGIGTQKEPILSYIWLTLASRHNNFEAIRARSLLLDEISAEQLALAKKNVPRYIEEYSDPFK